MNVFRYGIAAATEFRSKLPSASASCPVGTTCDGSKCEKKYAYGVGSPWPFDQIRLGEVPLTALSDVHAAQSGSILTEASMPTACRLRETICSEATQSDQPPMTCIWKLTGLPFGSISFPPLYVKPPSVNAFFAASGSYVASLVAVALSAGLIHFG